MGYGHSYKCENCGRRDNIILGVGMLYPLQCERTKEAAIEGKFGKTLQQATNDYPDGFMDCEKIIYACNCGGWKAEERI